MKWITNPEYGIFIKRINRFTCEILLNNKVQTVYLPNTGRLTDLLIEGSKVIIEKRREVGNTKHDLLLIERSSFQDNKPIWVSVDSHIPNKLARWAIENNYIKIVEFPFTIINEPRFRDGRFDLQIIKNNDIHYIEIKSVNYLDANGFARFPDAPTKRGTKHINELINLKIQGYHCWLLFIVMREDAQAFKPFWEIDPVFNQAVYNAIKSGVNVKAYKFKAGLEFEYSEEIKIFGETS